VSTRKAPRQASKGDREGGERRANHGRRVHEEASLAEAAAHLALNIAPALPMRTPSAGKMFVKKASLSVVATARAA
jgi:hypothetical protein